MQGMISVDLGMIMLLRMMWWGCEMVIQTEKTLRRMYGM